MAISKERLEELIKEKKTFWWCQPYADSFIVREIRLPHIKVVIKENYCVLIEDDKEYLAEFEHLTEDKYCAEEIAEFGNVARAEKLMLPNWNEFSKCDKSVKFFKDNTKYSMYVFVKNKNTNNCRIIIYADDNEQDWIVFEKPLTKENYYDARRLCVKLFKNT